jgi:serine/threonine-protein kinase RIO1
MSAHHRRERCNKYFLTASVPTISGISSIHRRTRRGILRSAPDQVLQDAHLRCADSLVARTHIHMRQLSARTGRLSIVVQARAGDSKKITTIGHRTNDVDHSTESTRVRRSKWFVRDGAHMVLKLTGDCTINGPVARVVNPRRHFICN